MAETTYRLSIETVKRLPAWALALAFALGDAWGHVSHGSATWGHRALSFVVSFGCASLVLGLPWRRVIARVPWKDFSVTTATAPTETDAP